LSILLKMVTHSKILLIFSSSLLKIMVSDKNKSYTFPERHSEVFLSTAFATALDILETCNHIANDFDKPTRRNTKFFCAGLYTHALEEYGKILYLKSLPVIDGTIEIDYSKFGGNKAHKTKFELVDNDKTLPESCKMFFGEKLPVGGSFDEAIAILQRTMPAEPRTRFQIFYSDFDDNGNITPYPEIDPERLKKSIGELWQIIFDKEREYAKELEEKNRSDLH